MKNKITSFIKGHSITTIWMLFYLLVQTVVSTGVMMFKLFKDSDYADLFLKVMEPIYEDGMPNIANSEEMINAYSSVLSEIILPILLISNLIIVLFFIIKNYIKKEKTLKKLKINDFAKYVFVGILLNLVISLIITLFPEELLKQHSMFTGVALNGSFLTTLIITGVISPIAEEVIFRYGIQRNLYRIHPIYAIIFQAITFGLLHGNPVQIIYATILGLIFGYIYYKTDNLLPAIILHVAINSSSVIISSTNINQFVGLIVLVVISFLFFILSNVFSRKVQKDS